MAVSSRDASSMAQLINRLIADQLNPCRTASSSSSSNPPLPLPLGSDFVMNDIPATFKLITSTASVSLLELIPDSTSSSHPSSAGNISNNTNFTSYTSSNTFIAFFPPQLLQQGQQLDNWLQSILAQAHSHLRTLVHRPHPVIAPSSSNSSAAAESSTNIISQRFLCKELGQQVTPARGHYRIYVAIQVNQNAHLIMFSSFDLLEFAKNMATFNSLISKLSPINNNDIDKNNNGTLASTRSSRSSIRKPPTDTLSSPIVATNTASSTSAHTTDGGDVSSFYPENLKFQSISASATAAAAAASSTLSRTKAGLIVLSKDYSTSISPIGDKSGLINQQQLPEFPSAPGVSSAKQHLTRLKTRSSKIAMIPSPPPVAAAAGTFVGIIDHSSSGGPNNNNNYSHASDINTTASSTVNSGRISAILDSYATSAGIYSGSSATTPKDFDNINNQKNTSNVNILAYSDPDAEIARRMAIASKNLNAIIQHVSTSSNSGGSALKLSTLENHAMCGHILQFPVPAGWGRIEVPDSLLVNASGGNGVHHSIDTAVALKPLVGAAATVFVISPPQLCLPSSSALDMLTGFVESAHTGMTQLTKTNPQFIPVESVAGGKLGYDKGSSNNSNSSSSDQNLRQEHPADSIDAVMQNYVLRTNGRTHYRVYAFIKITATQLISLVYYTNGMVVFTKFLEEFKKMIAAAVPAEILLGVNAVTSNSTASNSVVPAFPVTPSSASLTRSEKEILPIIPVQQLQLLQNPSRYDDEFDYSLTDSPALVPPPQLASSIIISPPIPTSAVSARTSFLPFKSNQSNNINNDSSNSSSSSAVKLRGLDDSDEDEDVVASRVMISGVSISNNETTPLQKPSIITTATSPGSPIISSLCDQLLLPTTIVPDAPFFSSKSCVGSMEGLYFGEAMGASRLNRSTKKMENAWMQVYLLLTHSGNRACITIPKFGGLSQLDDALLESLMSSSECNHGTYSIENDGDRLVIQWTGERDFTTVVGQPCLRRSIASVIDDDTIVFARREFTTLSDFRLLRVKSLPSALLKAASPGATPRSSLTNMIATTSGGGGGRDVNNSNGSTGSLHNNINARFQSPVSWSGKFAHSTATFPDKYYIEFFNNGEVLVTDEYILSQFSCVAVYAEEHDGIMVDESKLAAVNALGRWRYTCWHYTVEISSPTNEVQKFTVFLKRSGESAGVSSSGSGGGNVKDSGGGGSSKLVHQPRRAASLSDKIFGEFILDGNLYIRKG